MIRLRGQMSVEIHIAAYCDAWQPGVFNYNQEKLKYILTVGQVAQWLEKQPRQTQRVGQVGSIILRQTLFSDSMSDIRGTLFCQGTISGHSNSNLN